MRSLNKDGVIFTNILCSKSKVSPLNKKTLAKLELFGSIMLAELINHIRTKIDYKINKVFYYINSSPSTLKIFVANRVSEIQTIITVNTLVLLKDSNAHPLKWALGRIDNDVAGKVNLVKVAYRITQNGIREEAYQKYVPHQNQLT